MYNSYPPFPAVLPMLFVEIDHFCYAIIYGAGYAGRQLSIALEDNNSFKVVFSSL